MRIARLAQDLDQLPDGLETLVGEEEAAPQLEAEVEAPSAALEREDVSSAVRDALDALPKTQRMAMVLARFEGLSHAEIAEVIGSTEKAVQSLMHRARTALRTSLARFLDEGLQDGLAASNVDPQMRVRCRDCHLLVLKALQDQSAFGPQWTNKQITR